MRRVVAVGGGLLTLVLIVALIVRWQLQDSEADRSDRRMILAADLPDSGIPPKTREKHATSSIGAEPRLPLDTHYISEHDPHSEKYDPMQFAMSSGSPEIPWALEPRSEPWATEREAAIQRWLTEHLAKASPHAELASITCKKRTCKLVVSIPVEFSDEITDRYPIFMLAPSSTITSGEGRDQHALYLMYPATLLDDGAFAAYLERTMQQIGKERGSK